MPLQGIKVLDLSRILAGPYAAQILGDLGAEVIKVESPEGDETRRWGPPYIADNAAYFFAANRNKRSVQVDFNLEKNRDYILKLATEADVIIENFKTGSLAKFGFDYASINKINPKIIYCSITGFGQSGSAAQRTGFDAMIQAEAGLMSVTGTTESPARAGVPVADLATGLYATIAIQAALIERQKSGLGQHLDLALFDVQVSLLTNVAMNYLVSQNIPHAWGSGHPNLVPYQAFATANEPVYLAIGNDNQFARLVKVLDKDWQNDPRFQTNSARVQNRSEISSLIQNELLKKNKEAWLGIFENEKIPAAPLNDLANLKDHPLVREKKLFSTMDDGKTPNLRSPMNFSRTPITNYQTPPENAESDFIFFAKP